MLNYSYILSFLPGIFFGVALLIITILHVIRKQDTPAVLMVIGSSAQFVITALNAVAMLYYYSGGGSLSEAVPPIMYLNLLGYLSQIIFFTGLAMRLLGK